MNIESGRDLGSAIQMAVCRTRIRLGLPTLRTHPSPRLLYVYCFSYEEPQEQLQGTKRSGELLCSVRNWMFRLVVIHKAWLIACVQQSHNRYTGGSSSQTVVNPMLTLC